MKHIHLLAIASLFLSSCETTIRGGWTIYFDGSLGKYGMSGLVSIRKEIAGGQESWYFIPYVNWETKLLGMIQSHAVSNTFP